MYLHTFSDFKPAVGVMSDGSDSGIGSFGSFKWIPGHPTHKPPPFITTGATAVTKPPALEKINTIMRHYLIKKSLQNAFMCSQLLSKLNPEIEIQKIVIIINILIYFYLFNKLNFINLNIIQDILKRNFFFILSSNTYLRKCIKKKFFFVLNVIPSVHSFHIPYFHSLW